MWKKQSKLTKTTPIWRELGGSGDSGSSDSGSGDSGSSDSGRSCTCGNSDYEDSGNRGLGDSGSGSSDEEEEDSGSSEMYESPYFENYDVCSDSYSLAWRYLGVFIDEYDGYYSRKVLWAAYYDQNYCGNQIGEYAYYDWEKSEWDNSTCVSGSTCSRMDCHVANTANTTSSTWTLLGVYKESLEFGDDTFFEQLFKHQGVCLWGGDSYRYQFMQTMRGYDLANYGSCYQVESGIYIGAKPVEGGDLELAVYSDAYCTTELSSYSVDDYVSSSTGVNWNNAFAQWNYMMDAYKICQPCRAYSKSYNVQDDDDWGRNLVEYQDGQGNEEANGFNCYDDAGYRNCNQCYKFETHTDMEEASSDDLTLATKQGTILSIDVNGTSYGGPYTTYEATADVYYSSMGSVGLAVVVIGGLIARYRCKRRIITTEGDQVLDNELLS